MILTSLIFGTVTDKNFYDESFVNIGYIAPPLCTNLFVVLMYVSKENYMYLLPLLFVLAAIVLIICLGTMLLISAITKIIHTDLEIRNIFILTIYSFIHFNYFLMGCTGIIFSTYFTTKYEWKFSYNDILLAVLCFLIVLLLITFGFFSQQYNINEVRKRRAKINAIINIIVP